MKIISILPIYDPTNASVVRRVSLMNSVRELGIESKSIFIKSIVDCPEDCQILSNRKFSLLLARLVSFIKILRIIKRGDAILLSGFCLWELSLLSMFKKLKKFHLYNEITEYPDVVNFTGFKCNIFESILLKKLDGLFVISSHLKRYYSTKMCDPQNIFQLNMLVDMSRFASFMHKPHEKTVIAYCGSGVNTKDGVDLLIKAYAHLCKNYDNLELMLIGAKPYPDYDNNVSLAKQLGVAESIRFTGPVHYNKIPYLLQQADVLVLARPNSRQADGGFPTKLGEYLCTGIPVVTTNVGEIHNYLTDNENILFSKSESPVDIADRIEWVLQNQKDAYDIASRGKAQVYDNFSSISQARHLVNSIYISSKD